MSASTGPAWRQVPPAIAPPPGRAWWRPILAALVLAAPAVTLYRDPSAPAVGFVCLGLLLVAWVVPERPLLRAFPPPGAGARPGVGVLCAVATWSALAGHGALRTAVPYGLALVLPLVARLGHGAMERVVARFARIVGDLVAAVLFFVLGLLAVVVPWSVQRLVGADPLRRRPGWSPRFRRDPLPSNLWAPRSTTEVVPRAVRLRSLALAVGVVGVLLAVTPVGRSSVERLLGRVRSDAATEAFRLTPPPDDPARFEIRDRVPAGVEAYEPGPDGPQAAMLSSTWMAEGLYQSAQGWTLDPRNAWRPVNPHRLRDVRSAYLNVVDGERLTWAPPVGDRPRVTVWMFGGSTTYGLNQRDDHTIASELARVAHDAGIDLDVHNKGMNGQLHWMEAERFAWDLTTEARPDLVLFYDGVNESWETSLLNRFRTGDVPEMYDPTMIDAAINARGDQGPDGPDVPAGPAGSRLVGRPTGALLQLVAEARATVARYDRARGISRSTAQANSIPVRYFWQPSRVSRPLVPSEPHADTAGENAARLSEQLKVSFLPADVIDLSGALRGSSEPLFTDDVHHNEVGARLIATEMFARIGDDLRSVAAAKGSGG